MRSNVFLEMTGPDSDFYHASLRPLWHLRPEHPSFSTQALCNPLLLPNPELVSETGSMTLETGPHPYEKSQVIVPSGLSEFGK